MREKWLTEVPRTKEDCREALTLDDENITRSLISIFECHIGMGESALEAYENALRAFVHS